jgi:hypothetical protein
MDAAWRAPCTLGWSKPRVVHALQNREVDFRTWPPGHEAEIDWHAFETAHNFNLETGELSLVGLDLITVGIEVRVAADAELPASAQWARAATRKLRDKKKIPEGARLADLARLLEAEAKNAVKAGELHHELQASYLENQLKPWGIWPLSSFA